MEISLDRPPPSRPVVLRAEGAPCRRMPPTNEEILPTPQPSASVYVGGEVQSSECYDEEHSRVSVLYAADGGSRVLPRGAAPPAGVPVAPLGADLLRRSRTVKTPEELACLAHAAKVTRRALNDVACRVARVWEKGEREITEAEIARMFEYFVARHGCGAEPLAFPTIAASGVSGVTLHHVPALRPAPPHVPIILDAGCRYRGYCADITITLGCDREPWRSLHQSVRAALRHLVKFVRPGRTLADVEEEARRRMRTVLSEAKLPDDALPALMPHLAAHHVGVDVHDFCDDTIPLVPDMALALELGVYVPDAVRYAPAFTEAGGIRVETGVAVTRGGCRLLWSGPPGGT